MFPLTRPYRQIAATAAVVLLTIVPTCYVGVTAWRISRQVYRHEIEVDLGRQLGFDVRIASVRYPRPGEVIYRGVLLRRQDARVEAVSDVAGADSLRIRRSDRELTVLAERLWLKGGSAEELLGQLESLLQKAGGGTYEHISLSATHCTVELGTGVASYDLRELVGEYHVNGNGPSLRASYRIVPDVSSAGTRCELAFSRDRSGSDVQSTLAFRTMEGLPLPVRVLEPFFATAEWVGPDARFDGGLTLSQKGGDDWGVEFQGNVTDIDLHRLIERRFPDHRLKGKGKLRVELARWGNRPGQGPGWVEARGQLTTGPGVMSLGLLHALSTEMRFRKGPRVARLVSSTGVVDLDFRSIGLRFDMKADGEILVTGALGNEYPEGVVILGPTDPLAYEPEGTAHVRGLIKTLVPVKTLNHAMMVPLTERSRQLLRLPVGPDVGSKPIGGN